MKIIATKTIGKFVAGRIFDTEKETAEALIRLGRAKEWTPDMKIPESPAENREKKIIIPDATKSEQAVEPKRRGRKPKNHDH